MKINEIKIINYRNIENIEMNPCPGVNIIYGENAQGKTNILESLFLFTGLKSFRGSKDSELVNFSKEFAKISVSFETLRRKQSAQLKITDRRRAVLNGVHLQTTVGLMGSFPASLFSPGFLSIIQNGPSERRKFTDSAICQLKPYYAGVLAEYQSVLKQRNAVLKFNENQSETLDILECLNWKFSQLGELIYKERQNYLELLTPIVTEIFSGLSSGKEEISFSYKKVGDKTGDTPFSENLKNHEKASMAAKITLVGPHRDDIDININGISARSFGSQGQKRSAAIALKLSEAEVIKQNTEENPIILLDDVMSELDTSRQDYILNHIMDKQVFITCCDPASILRMSDGKTFNIVNGRLN